MFCYQYINLKYSVNTNYSAMLYHKKKVIFGAQGLSVPL